MKFIFNNLNFSSDEDANPSSLQNFNGLNLNPNIGLDGRNKPLAGNIATAMILVTGFGMLIPIVLYEGVGVDLGYNWDIFAYIAPCISESILIPSLFFVRNPNAIRTVLEALSEMFGFD